MLDEGGIKGRKIILLSTESDWSEVFKRFTISKQRQKTDDSSKYFLQGVPRKILPRLIRENSHGIFPDFQPRNSLRESHNEKQNEKLPESFFMIFEKLSLSLFISRKFEILSRNKNCMKHLSRICQTSVIRGTWNMEKYAAIS